jgi:hypothetical protein
MATEPRDSEFADEDEHEAEGFDPAELATAAVELIVDQARTYPARTIGIAFGIGYVLGGGVPRFAVRLAGVAIARSITETVLGHDAAGRIAGGIWRGARARRANGRSS